MKTNYLFLAFSFAAMTLVSCCNEVDDALNVQEELIESQDSIFTYDMYFDSEITSYDGTTRATTASDWEDGDIVYIHFRGNNNAYGQAEYISSSKKWRVTCEKALGEATNNQCYVWYGKGYGDPYSTDELIMYSFLTEAFITSKGEYTYSNNSIYVNATMKPYNCRLRFKGTPGTEVGTGDVIEKKWFRFCNINKLKSSAPFEYAANSFLLTVGSNGYTDYFVIWINEYCTSISIYLKNTNERYEHYFDQNTLKVGESGCFTLPTSSDLHGWTRVYD